MSEPEERKPFTYNRQSPEELEKLAWAVMGQQVFGSWNLPKGTRPGMVFMLMSFLDEQQLKELQAAKIAACYEYLSEAGERSVNGLPMFMSVRFLDEQDMETMAERVRQLEAIRVAGLEKAKNSGGATPP